MRLLFAARAIDGMAGGVERMVIALANEMAARGHEVGLVTWDGRDAQAFYPISPAIQWHKIDIGSTTTKATPLTRVRRAIAVRRLVRRFQPDVITAFQGGPFKALRLYCYGINVPMIVAERNAPTIYDHTSAGEKGRREAFRAYGMARFLVVQCEAYREMHPVHLQEKLFAIPNPVYPAQARAAPHIPSAEGRYRLLSVGRLCYQKNFESLIMAFSRLETRFSSWDLSIIGEGEGRKQLDALIRRKHLSSRILLPGATKSISAYYVASHVFCLPSRWEGFPNALAEALAHGLPAVGYAECAGTNVLIEHGSTGLLAAGNGDPESLSYALAEMMEDAAKRRAMGDTAISAMARFAPDIIMDRWEDIFHRAMA